MLKYLAMGLLLALLMHFPHLAAFAAQLAAVLPVLAAHAIAYGLSQPWVLALALVLVCHRLAARRLGW